MKSQGFPKRERVRRSEEFTRIIGDGERIRSRLLSAFWIFDDASGTERVNRVGIAAGKRLGKAAVRNRLKRRVREAYRRNKRELPCLGIAIVFMASPKMIGKSAEEITSDLIRLLGEIRASAESRSRPSESSSSSTEC